MSFRLSSPFKPSGDQPQAIAKLVRNLKSNAKHQVLLGVTGSGKTFSLAKVIEKLQRPTLIIEPNKTLAAQTYQEFKEFFPQEPVHYFVSYYDYYQPEAYIPQSDTYIEKDAKINEEIDRLRHLAVQDLLSKKKAVIVASVSCIYNLGQPETYQEIVLEIKSGQKISRQDFLRQLVFLQYQRNDFDFKPGVFRVRGEVVEVFLVTGREILRIEFQGNKIEKLSTASVLDKDASNLNPQTLSRKSLYPAKFWIAPPERLKLAFANIRLELQGRVSWLKKQGLILESQRLEQRTNFDLQMLLEAGYCSGVENYSRHLEFRRPNQAPFTLLDFFKLANPNFLVFIDESHLTCSQLKAMAVQDRARKNILIEYGFRLPSALDNRPLTYGEFEKKSPQIIYVSATPGELEKSKISLANGEPNPRFLTEQLVRPTGLLEPEVELRAAKNQVQNLLGEIKKRITKKQKVLVITLTKRLAEDLNDFLKEQGIRSQWLHSETKSLERPRIIKELREGKIDVLVGVNLLREGLDLPEVSLVAILDADKEGFLRSATTLVQTMGRAARHLEGRVILYADKKTGSMAEAVREINRRRQIQLKYNRRHRIKPQAIVKEIRDWSFGQKEETLKTEFMATQDRKLLEQEMKEAAANLDFERAALIRDQLRNLRNNKTT